MTVPICGHIMSAQGSGEMEGLPRQCVCVCVCVSVCVCVCVSVCVCVCPASLLSMLAQHTINTSDTTPSNAYIKVVCCLCVFGRGRHNTDDPQSHC